MQTLEFFGFGNYSNSFGRVRGVVLYTLNEHGGSRNVRGCVQAENPAKTLRRFCVDRFPETPYISPEEWEQIEENREYYFLMAKKSAKHYVIGKLRL